MRKLLAALVAGGLCLLAGFTTVLAQDDARMSRYVPVHAYLCTYNDGQDADDLEEAVEVWTEFADDADVDNYSAWTLTKWFFGEQQDFDVIWLGAWKDWNAMGSGFDAYLNDGSKAAAKFAEVITCDTHMVVASRAFKLPADGTPSDGIITFSNCNMKDDAEFDDLVSASNEWARRIGDAGSEAAIYQWFPVFGGGGDEAADMLWVESYPNFASLGADLERTANGGFYQQAMELFDDLVDCDASRAYLAKSRRFTNIRE